MLYSPVCQLQSKEESGGGSSSAHLVIVVFGEEVLSQRPLWLSLIQTKPLPWALLSSR
jgi:hypothetical protein